MYKEPTGREFAGRVHYQASPSAYEGFMDEQGIPIYRGIGVYDVRQLGLAPWPRIGGEGAFIELDGQAGMWGMYVVEVPARSPLNSEHHIYEEIFLVIEGRGTTEVWGGGNGKKRIFEWQPGSHFAVPLNTWHRLVNATSSPALVLAATNAPHIMESFQSRSFIFENSFEFSDRYDHSEDYFKPRDELVTDPESGRAMLRSSLLPDIIHCYLPLDNNRAPGYRWVTPRMAGNTFFGGNIGEYPSGRYSKAHYHQAGAVLVCLKGKGYTYNWPVELGPRPWEAGKGDLVKVQDYIAGGMVSAAPGGGNWFHQHFSTGKDCLRVRAIMNRELQRNAQKHSNVRTEISEGGRAIGYLEEDPQIRKNYKEALQREGVEFQMPESLYRQ